MLRIQHHQADMARIQAIEPAQFTPTAQNLRKARRAIAYRPQRIKKVDGELVWDLTVGEKQELVAALRGVVPDPSRVNTENV